MSKTKKWLQNAQQNVVLLINHLIIQFKKKYVYFVIFQYSEQNTTKFYRLTCQFYIKIRETFTVRVVILRSLKRQFLFDRQQFYSSTCFICFCYFLSIFFQKKNIVLIWIAVQTLPRRFKHRARAFARLLFDFYASSSL